MGLPSGRVGLKFRADGAAGPVYAYCTYDQFTPDGDEYYIVNIPMIENDYHFDIILGFGAKCECLAPSHVRTKIKRKIQNMAAIYDHETLEA